MPVPSLITDLSQTAGSNYPSGGDSPSTLDDVQRAHASFIALLRDGKGQSAPVSLASAATVDIGAQNSQFVEITGTTGITSFGTTYNGPRYLRFQGAVLLTHNSTSLNLPGAANVTTAAGDVLIAEPNLALNGWNVVAYHRAALAPGAASTVTNGLYTTDIGTTVQGYDANTVKKNAANTFTVSQRGTVTSDNDLSFDLNATNNFSCTPTAGGTLTFTNITAGQSGFIKLVNGSNYAIAAHANTKISATALSRISATGTYILSYFSDGTNVYVVTSESLA